MPSAGPTPVPGGEAQQTAPTSEVTVPAEHPGLTGHFTGTFEKQDGEPIKVGTPVRWEGDLTNNGDVPLFINGLRLDIAPGQTLPDVTIHNSHVTQADIDAGTISFATEYTVTTPRGTRLSAPAITGSLPIPAEHPGLTGHFTGTFEKQDGEPIKVGTRVRWESDLTNNGDVPLFVNDLRLDIAPGQTLPDVTIHYSHVTQADIDAGTISFATEYTVTTPRGTRLSAPAITGSLPIPAEHPGLTGHFTGTFEKQDGEPIKVGTRVRWESDLTNNGDVPLFVNDLRLDIAAGQTLPDVTIHYSHVTQADIDAGTISFATEYTVTTPRGTRLSAPAITGSLPIPAEHPGIDGHFTGVLDTKDGEPVTAGTWITWTAELANTGDVELSTIDGVDVDLAPGETTDHFSWRSQVTQADLDTGSISVSKTYDAVTVTGTRFTSGAVTGSVALPAPAERPGLSGEFEGHLELKTGEAVKVGTRITWIAYPVNSGDVELRNINDTTMVLTPGQPAPYYQVRAEVTQADLDAGSITFSRTFSGTTPLGTRYSTPFTGTFTLPTGPAAG